ncbi:MAG TPA: dynamin family protein [Gemmatimonadales bacterium]|jgi:small GTP-binding protein|nr:dynamin family protein [Gemmatimonadales bacterium]
MIGKLFRRRGILSDREQELRAREAELLERLAAALARFGPDVAADDLQRFREVREQLAGLFLLVIAGEFNSGKSSFINALLGEAVLPEGVTPTTDRINLLRYGPAVTEQLREAYLLDRTHPAELLRELNVVDTPGTNAVIRRHEELTRDFIPRSDLVLFVTSADRPFTESERAFLEQIREWGKKVVFIVNKVDILRTPEERNEVVTFVRDNATALLGEPPEIFPVSAREAQAARAGAGDEAKWEHSGFGAVEHYLLRTLDQEERVRLKLLSPLNVGLRLAQRYKDAAFERLKLLADDVEAIANIDRQLTAFHQEMLRDLDPRLARLDLLLGEMEGRGIRFFDETIRLGRIKTLLDSEGVKRAFAHEVVADTPQEIETEVGKVIDWIVERNLRVWQDIQSYVTRQASRHREGMIGEVGSTFSYNRQALLNSVGRVSREVIGSYDREGESRAIANDVQGTFATAALAEAGAVGIGTMVATLLTGVAADVTGIVLAAALAIGGFYLIPRRRRQAQEAFRARVADLRNRLKQGLTRQAHHEIGQATERVNEAIAPYRRFVETQQTQLNEARGELVAVEDTLLRLKSEIERR